LLIAKRKGINKKGSGLVTQLAIGVGALILAIIFIGVMIETVLDADLLTSGGALDNSTAALSANFSTGVDEVSAKIPTIFKVAIIVLILTVLVLLWDQWKRMRMGEGSGSAGL